MFAEIAVEHQFLQLWLGLQRHFYHLCLAVCVGCEVGYARLRVALCQVVLAVAIEGRYVESLDKGESRLAVLVAHIIYSTRVVFLKHRHVYYLRLALLGLRALRFAHKHLVGHTCHLVGSVFIEDDDVVDVRAVAHKLVLLQPRSHESVGAVDIEFLVCFGHGGGLYGVEVAYFGQSRMLGSIFVLQESEPVGSHLDQVVEVALYLFKLGLDAGNEFVGLVFVELQYALHLDFEQSQQVVAGHFAHKVFLKRLESLVDILQCSIGRFCILKLFTFVYTFFDEYLFERTEVQLLEQFVASYLEFALDEVFGVIHRASQHIAHREELRHAVVDHTAVGRYAYLAIGECIQGIDGLIARHAWHQVYQYLDTRGRVVIHLACFYLAFLYGFQYRVDKCCSRFAKRYLADSQSLVVDFLNLCTNTHRSASLSVVIL